MKLKKIIAFLEEKNSPFKLINVISNLYNSLTIFDSIVSTLKKMYLKFTITTPEIYQFTIEQVEKGNNNEKQRTRFT